LKETTDRVAQVLAGEEEHFTGTIDSGLERIEKIFDEMKQEKRGVVRGDDVFEMYQTYGFPPELFETLAAEHNYGFDWPGFQDEMKRHGELSGSGEKNVLFKHDPLEGIKKAMHGCRFLGYESLICEDAKIVAIVAENQLVDSEDDLDQEKPITLVLDKTPFYGERGGQVGDTGEIRGSNFHMRVTDTQIDGEFILHIGHLRQGTVSLGQTVTARVDAPRRAGIARAHTATHLLHRALRQHLGSHAEQQGSKVDDDLLRFDFTNPKAVAADLLARIEEDVNLQILQALEVRSEIMPLEEARKAGAMMLFGEKYPDRVRVVRMGGSSELCGGTHLKNSSEVGLFQIAAEESVSAGTRRITAMTGLESYRQLRRREAILRDTTTALKIPPEELPERAATMAKEIRKLRKELASGTKQQGVSIDELLEKAVDIAGVKVILEKIPDANPNVLRETIDRIRRKNDSSAILLAAQQGKDKILLVAGLTRDLVDKGLDAVQWVRDAASEVQGGGGGRPDLAQAGGKLPEKLPEAFQKAKEKITEFLK
jgi:alanyl-tRNA synthetase